MAWIKRWLPTGHANAQAGLVLLASIPCLLTALLALWWTGMAWSLLAFIGILLLLPICYGAYTGRRRADYQLQTLSNLVEAMIDGDYSLRGRRQNNPAFQELLETVNRLAETLQRHKLQAEESQLLLEKVMDQMDAMVLAVDPAGRVALSNASARKLLAPACGLVDGQSLDELGLASLVASGGSGVVELDLAGVRGEYFLFRDRFISSGLSHELLLLTRADRLLREKERQAWQRLLRVLGHEMNNSLTPIATFSRGLLKRLERDPAAVDHQGLTEGLAIIRERAESLHGFLARYRQLSNLPAPDKRPFDWREALSRSAELMADCRISNHLYGADELSAPLYGDPQQLQQVFVNLLKNAGEAMADSADRQIELAARREPHWLHILIRDCGAGIANPDNLFVPFYTTKPGGSGIGLTLCRQILMNHNGQLSLRAREDGPGAEAVISLPLLETPRG